MHYTLYTFIQLTIMCTVSIILIIFHWCYSVPHSKDIVVHIPGLTSTLAKLLIMNIPLRGCQTINKVGRFRLPIKKLAIFRYQSPHWYRTKMQMIKSAVCHGSTILLADFLGQLNHTHKICPTLSINHLTSPLHHTTFPRSSRNHSW